jgi:hypothetical protein
MEEFESLNKTFAVLIPLIILVVIWELTWKLIAMWKAGRNNHLGWFICLFLINTAGILPIIYILTHRKNPSGNKISREYDGLK